MKYLIGLAFCASVLAQLPKAPPVVLGGSGGGGGGSGTVTSVATGCGLTGGPITTTGTLAGTGPCYAAGGGTAQAQTATYSPAVTSLTAGLTLSWLPLAPNTAAAPTFSPNGLTAEPIVKVGGAALIANDLTTTAIAVAVYNSGSTHWELQNPQTVSTVPVTSVTGALANTLPCNNTGSTANLINCTPGQANALLGIPTGPSGALQSNQSGALYGDSNFAYYPTGIADPAQLTPTAVGATDGTTYGYQIVLSLGNPATGGIWAFTAPSTEGSVVGNSTLSGSNYNSISLPTTSDPNIYYTLVRTTGPATPQIISVGELSTAMSPILDQANGSSAVFNLSTVNNTAPTLMYGSSTGFPANLASAEGEATAGSSALAVPDAFGNYLSFIGWDGLAGWSSRIVGGSSYIYNPDWIVGGEAWNVVQVNTTGTGCGVAIVTCLATPYTIQRSDGFIRGDSTAGNIAVTLPDPTAGGFPLGRIYLFHKADASGNTFTVNAGSGQTINGQSSYILTGANNPTLGVYFDGTSWASFTDQVGYTGAQIVTACTTITGGVPTGCSNVTNTYVNGRLQ